MPYTAAVAAVHAVVASYGCSDWTDPDSAAVGKLAKEQCGHESYSLAVAPRISSSCPPFDDACSLQPRPCPLTAGNWQRYGTTVGTGDHHSDLP